MVCRQEPLEVFRNFWLLLYNIMITLSIDISTIIIYIIIKWFTLNITLVIKYGKWQVRITRLISISNINYKYTKFNYSKGWL